MSDESDRDDSVLSDEDGTSATDESDVGVDGFLDLEAEESEEYDEDEDEDDDRCYESNAVDALKHSSFPQFSSLPAELRIMIWEAADPYLKMENNRVLMLRVFEDGELWESLGLEQQTASARALLATNRESRSIVLKYYPDVIQLRKGRGHVRFRSDRDIVFLNTPSLGPELPNAARWCGKVQHLAYNCGNIVTSASLRGYEHLKRLFYCVDTNDLKMSQFREKIVPKPVNTFFTETYLAGEDEWLHHLFCWPQKLPDNDFSQFMSEAFFPLPPDKQGTVPQCGMVQFSFSRAVKAYGELGYSPEHPPPADLTDSSSESDTDSSDDEYELDGFVVESSAEESDDEDEGGEVEEVSDEDADGEAHHDDYGPFEGFSPLQEDDSDEADRDEQLPAAAAFSSLEPESPRDEVSAVSSSDEEPVATKQSSRLKRRVVSSDDEEGGEPAADRRRAEMSSRPKKRARVIVSDSDDDDEDEVEHTTKARSRLNLVDEDDEEDEDEEEEAEVKPSKPMSLLARLRQFRSDVPVPLEGDSATSDDDEMGPEDEYGRDYCDEDDDFGDEGAVRDAEYPDSAEEMEDDGW
ncbi:hypothetical protein F5Y17DRAFT_444404 [Xylariaceae sp. FL0594]|nr:hypothetical protein F5Y17DRAFT_444404 [Xylariaceae sp. FL0594]